MTDATDVTFVALTLGMAALLVAWIATRGERRLAIFVAGVVALWLAATALVATRGLLRFSPTSPPRFVLLPLVAMISFVLAIRTRAAARLLDATPRHWPIAAQSFRIVVELALYALFVANRAPRQVTFEGRNFDVLAGLTAPLVAWLVATGRIGTRLVFAWNLAGIALLANIVGTVVTSVPGPLHHDWQDAPFTTIATWPTVWLGAFLAPLALFFHAASLRQCATWRSGGA